MARLREANDQLERLKMNKDDVLSQVSDALKDLQSCSDLTMRDGDFARTEASRLLALIAAISAAPAVAPHCATCNDNGLIGGPSFADPGEGGVPCPDCTISREQWIEQAMRVYLIAGDTEQVARECATYLWGEVDKDDLPDATDAAMEDVEGRGPTPQAGAESYPPAPEPDTTAKLPRLADGKYHAVWAWPKVLAYAHTCVDAALRARGAVPSGWPYHELRFIMRVLSHKGGAPKQDWDTAYGMARTIFERWHREALAAPQPPAALPGEQDAALWRMLRDHIDYGEGGDDWIRIQATAASVPAEFLKRFTVEKLTIMAAHKVRTDGGAA